MLVTRTVSARGGITDEAYLLSGEPDIIHELAEEVIDDLKRAVMEQFNVPLTKDSIRVYERRDLLTSQTLVTAVWSPPLHEVKLEGGPLDGDIVAIPADEAPPAYRATVFKNAIDAHAPEQIKAVSLAAETVTYYRKGINTLTNRWVYEYEF